MTLGLVEGATAAVLVKQHFGTAASPLVVNLAVAVVSGAPALSNVLSFVWANIAHGRARVRLVVALQAAFALLVGTIAFAPRAAGGLALRRRRARGPRRRVALSPDACAPRVPAAGGRIGERRAQRALQSENADAHSAGGCLLSRVHAVDGNLRRGQSHDDRAAGRHL